MSDPEFDDLVYVCQACGHEDDPDKFGKYCPACGSDLDELEADSRQGSVKLPGQTVEDFIPTVYHQEQVDLLRRLGNQKVLEVVDGTKYVFPSAKHTRVFRWAVLSNGSVIGHNESLRTGSSFPVLGNKAMRTFYSRYRGLPKPQALQDRADL